MSDENKMFGNHDLEETVEYDADTKREIPVQVCRRCGCRYFLDGRTQVIPSMDCDYELVKRTMRE